ncbi:MAG TPA: NAD(P)H-dependent oxidoreductase [Phycicoccus sp.]|nr:NAD(P)H-dependent oxidoreductase [Phycicoccus sp.]
MTLPRLLVIIGSTRPGRVGPAFANWFVDRARAHGGFEVEVADLAEIDLPMFNEAKHPKFGDYEHQHTKDWSATVAAADAIVFVVPEYNYGYNAATKNAIDYLSKEWADKAVSFVSYGGIGGGTRAVQQLKQVVTTLRMVPIFESINIPFAANHLDEERKVKPSDERDAAADVMLDELLRVTSLLRPAAFS